jgi:hypothetical protein
MTLSNFGKPFRVAKEMHPLALEVLIGACSKLGSFVVDFATLIGMYVLSLLLLHWIFKLKCFLTFYFLRVIMCWHARILAKTYWHLMEIKRSLARFFILFFKMKDLEPKNCQNIPQILNLLSINTQRLIWIVSKFELSLVEIGQNVTSLFATTCHYYLFATIFGHFCNYFLCWSYLQLDYN